MSEANDKCVYCCDDGFKLTIAWRCKDCKAPLCSDCLFTQIDCYDLHRRCPGCDAKLQDSDGNTPTDWKAIGYGPGPTP